MRWKDLSLKGKFAVSFGVVLAMLAAVAVWAILGIGGIVGNAGQVIRRQQAAAASSYSASWTTSIGRPRSTPSSPTIPSPSWTCSSIPPSAASASGTTAKAANRPRPWCPPWCRSWPRWRSRIPSSTSPPPGSRSSTSPWTRPWAGFLREEKGGPPGLDPQGQGRHAQRGHPGPWRGDGLDQVQPGTLALFRRGGPAHEG